MNITVTAGDILKEEFLEPLGISQYKLAKDLKVSRMLISKIVHGYASISADTAVRLAKYFGTTPEFWLNLQNMIDIKKAKMNMELNNIEICAFCPAE